MSKKFVITQKFESVFSGDTDQLDGDGEDHFDISWRIRIYPGSPVFQIDLDCFVGPDYMKWSIDALIEWKLWSKTGWKLVSMTEVQMKQRQKGLLCFDWKHHADCFLDDTLEVECTVEIMDMKGFERKSLRRFDESMKEVSDVVFIVEEERFYVSKLFLASQSTHFKTLIFENSQNSQVLHPAITLQDLDALHFQYYLEVLYGHQNALDDKNVAILLELGEKFDTPTVTERCEQYLTIESDMNILGELILAIQYKLDSLKDDCLSELQSIEDIQRIVPDNPDDIPLEVMSILFRKIISFL